MARTTDERLDYLMEQLEKGTQNIFESGRYAEYPLSCPNSTIIAFATPYLFFCKP